MSKSAEQNAKKTDMIEDFINGWAKISANNPELTLGDWLKTFAIMTGLAISMAELSEESFEEAINDMADMSWTVYQDSLQQLTRATLQ